MCVLWSPVSTARFSLFCLGFYSVSINLELWCSCSITARVSILLFLRIIFMFCSDLGEVQTTNELKPTWQTTSMSEITGFDES